MGAIIVVLSNLLIGQLSNRYNEAQEKAEIQYSIDKAKFITKVEKSRFVCWVSILSRGMGREHESKLIL